MLSNGINFKGTLCGRNFTHGLSYQVYTEVETEQLKYLKERCMVTEAYCMYVNDFFFFALIAVFGDISVRNFTFLFM